MLSIYMKFFIRLKHMKIVILRILRKSPNILTRACNIAIVFLWSITPITPRCLVCSEVVICNPGQSVVHIYEVLYSLKAHENSG